MKMPRLCRFLALLSGVAVALSSPSLQAIPVFPGAVGFGTQTPAGRGGAIVRVTSLLDDGSVGTLRNAVESTSYGYPRIVIFEVSGVISLNSDLKIRDGRGTITIAGQTAPGPVIIEGGGVAISGDDVLIQHIAVRPGVAHPTTPSLTNRDCFKVEAIDLVNVNNIVLDHVSGGWSTDEIFSTWGNDSGTVTNVTVSNSLFSEALRYPGRTDSHANNPPGYGHSAGILFGRNTANATYFRNISAYNMFRNPYANYTATNIQVVNNFAYGPGRRIEDRMLFGDNSATSVITLKGNWTMLNTPSLTNGIINHVLVGSTAFDYDIYQADNFISDNAVSPTVWPATSDPWDSSVTSLSGRALASVKLTSEPSQFTALGLPVVAASTVEALLKPRVGARPLDRDPVDARIVAEITARSNKDWIDTPAGAPGGYPTLTPVTRSPVLVLPATPNATNAEGYTDAERWLHAFSADLEAFGDAKPIDPAIATFDTFTDGNDNGWSWNGVTNWAVTSGVYRQSNTTGGARALLAGTNWTDQVVEAKIVPTSFVGSNRFVAVYARYRDINHAYYVALRSNNTVELKKVVGGTASLLAAAQPLNVAPNSIYQVRLVVSGTSVSAVVNNLTAGTSVTFAPVTDTSLTSGQAAIGTYCAAADFDNVFASPTPTAVSAVLDDFDDGNATGWTTEASPVTAQAWSVVTNGAGATVYRQDDFTGGARASTGSAATANQTVQADVKPTAISGTDRFVAVYGRYTDINNGYYLALRSTGKLELKRIKAGTITDYTPTPAPTVTFALNTWYVLKIEVTGTSPTTIKGYVNGNLVLTATDSSAPLLTGKGALGTYMMKAEFDDVALTAP